MKLKPKYLKEEYTLGIGNNPDYQESYKDVPGWINDAEFIYEEIVNQAKDGDHFVEIGVLLGQSTTRMAELIKKSHKKIKFDAIDIFWLIPHTLERWEENGHPKQIYDYYINLTKLVPTPTIMDIVKHPLRNLKLEEYVNFITCDEKYAHRLYDDNSLKFVWIDGDHGEDIVYNDLVNFWPKLKKGGVIAGDDIAYEGVLNDVKKFSKEYNVEAIIGYPDSHNAFRIIKK
jgi:predicted O-methyltransferase YrrM